VSVLLGIDLGDRRIGVASGDTASGAVTALRTLRRATPHEDAATIGRLCAEHGAEAVVVGLPIHLDGRESVQSRLTREWVAAVVARLKVPVTLRDERLTSRTAENRLGRPPRGRAGGPPSGPARRAWRARIDREAAADIVQRELDARAATGGGSWP
jgi:putative Holliday junction resolvase